MIKPFALAASLLLSAAPVLVAQTYPTAPDPRNGLKPGMYDAGTAEMGLKLVSFTPKPAAFDTVKGLDFINSDIAFRDHYVYQGNFAGFTIWDVKNPAKPVAVAVVPCITAQGDPSIIGHLLFISAEGRGNHNDCSKGVVKDPADHMMGVRIYDVADPAHPKLIKNVQTCKGSHTHTVVPDPKNSGIVYLYVSGFNDARPATELAGCKNGSDPADTTNSMYRLDIIRVPLAHPEQAEVVTGARVFTGLGPEAQSAARKAAEAGRTPRRRAFQTDTTLPVAAIGPVNCHDVTAYPAMHLLAGACGSYGLLVDISNPLKPVRVDAKADTNFSLWHTAVFSNDGSKVVFTDEWGGGVAPNCQATSMLEMGGNAVLTISRTKKFTQHAYFKIPTAQTAQENCVSHNGGLIPVPGRDLMAQGWYQGGIDISDFTDPDHPYEVAYFDRGSIDPPPAAGVAAAGAAAGEASAARGERSFANTIGGSWGAYYWNGYIYSSELARGFDIYQLVPTDKLSANEIAAAKLVRFVEYNPQSQPHIEWPAAFPVVRSYLDQLVRDDGLSAARTGAIAKSLDAAEKETGAARGASLTKLAAQVDGYVAGAKDQKRVKALSYEVKRLAAVSK